MAGAGNAEFKQAIEADYNHGMRLYQEYLTSIFSRNPERALRYRKALLEHIDKYPIVLPMEDSGSPFVPISEVPRAPMVHPNARGPHDPLGRWNSAPIRPVARRGTLNGWLMPRGGKRKRTRRRN